MVTEHGICDHDLRKEIRILVKILFLFSIKLKGVKLWWKSCIVQDSDQQVKLHIVSQFVQYKENKILILLFSCTRFVMSHIFLVISAGFEPRNTIYHTSYPSHWTIKYGKLSNLQNWPLSNCLNWFSGKITNSTISDRFNLQNIQISDESSIERGWRCHHFLWLDARLVGVSLRLGYHSMGFGHFLRFRNFVRSSILSRSATRIYHVYK